MSDVLSVRITPTTKDVLSMRSKVVELLSAGSLSRNSLLNQLAQQAAAPTLSLASRDELESVLTEDHKHVAAVRYRNAAIVAVHQLEGERVIQTAPTGVPLEFSSITTGNSMFNTTGGQERVAAPKGMSVHNRNQDMPEILQLTSLVRGWSSEDHEAFDLEQHLSRPSSRLISADGVLVLEEALENLRLGRFMSSTFMLGAFSETVWMEAASLCAPADADVASEVEKAQPGADRVMTKTLDFLAPKPKDFTRKQLEPWIRSTLAVRNIIGHANVLQNRTGSFTETSTAIRLVDSYRNVNDLDEALRRAGL